MGPGLQPWGFLTTSCVFPHAEGSFCCLYWHWLCWSDVCSLISFLTDAAWSSTNCSAYQLSWWSGVAITNAINFTYGLDGLASCLSLIFVLDFVVIFYLQGRTRLALPTTLPLCGAILGFLPYNVKPFRDFYGRRGQYAYRIHAGDICISQYLMLVPITDMCMSVLRCLIKL